MDGDLSRLSYQNPLSYGDEKRGSLGSQEMAEVLDGPPREGSLDTGGSPAPNMSRQATEGSLEMETAVDNQGDDNNDPTDSSSTWSPEVLQPTSPRCHLGPGEPKFPDQGSGNSPSPTNNIQ